MKTKVEQKNTPADHVPARRKTLSGVVMSDKMKDTIVVLVERYVKHPKYAKYIQYRKRYKVHDAGNTKKIGETVTIRECKPMSRHKRFEVLS